MDSKPLDQPFRFMDLPSEMRRRVYEMLFFDNDGDPPSIQVPQEIERPWPPDQNYHQEEPVHTAPWQVHPYGRADPTDKRLPTCGRQSRDTPQYKSPTRFSLSIFRVSRTIQEEAEAVFYGSASFNLMGGQFWNVISSWAWLSQLPRRYRRLIRHIEHFSFTSRSINCRRRAGDISHSFFDWSVFMQLLAQECRSLQSLRLWLMSDTQEFEWLANARKTDPWVQALLLLQDLPDFRNFDMPGIRPRWYPEFENVDLRQYNKPWLDERRSARPVQSAPAENASIVGWLKSRLEHNRHPKAPLASPQISSKPFSSFPIFRLPRSIRDLIYRHLLLPSNKRLHPYIGSWYDQSTQNAVPLFRSCRGVRCEAEEVLYGQAIFTHPRDSEVGVTGALQHFFEVLPSRLRAKVRHILIDGLSKPHFFIYLAKEMQIDTLHCVLSGDDMRDLQIVQSRTGQRMRISAGSSINRKYFRDALAQFKTIQMSSINPDDTETLLSIQGWITKERRAGLRFRERCKSLRPRKTLSSAVVKR